MYVPYYKIWQVLRKVNWICSLYFTWLHVTYTLCPNSGATFFRGCIWRRCVTWLGCQRPTETSDYSIGWILLGLIIMSWWHKTEIRRPDCPDRLFKDFASHKPLTAPLHIKMLVLKHICNKNIRKFCSFKAKQIVLNIVRSQQQKIHSTGLLCLR